jgi:putative transposase
MPRHCLFCDLYGGSPAQRARSEWRSAARSSFTLSARTHGVRRVWHDILVEGISCGLHRIERFVRQQALLARLRRRGLPKDNGERSIIADNVLDRQFAADRPNQKEWTAKIANQGGTSINLSTFWA